MTSNQKIEDIYKDDAPEHLQDNPFIIYSRLRYADREEYKAALPHEQQRRIREELERIGRIRSRFGARVDNLPVDLSTPEAKLSRIKEAKSRWIKEAAEKAKLALKNAEIDGDKESKARSMNDLRILRAIQSWKPMVGIETPGIRSAKDSGSEFTVCEITLSKDFPENGPHKSSYGSYKIKKHTLDEVLDENDTNPLKAKCKSGHIRYFHFPANNMAWIEEAIARYYGEKVGEYNWRKSPIYQKKSSNLLCRQFWTAQQYGGLKDPIHARHMRPMCSLIPTDTVEDVSPTGCDSDLPLRINNFVIFMPYLHWETDRNRKRMADIITKLSNIEKEKQQKNAPRPTGLLAEAAGKAREKFGNRVPTEVQPPKRQPTIPTTALGNYLLLISRLYEGMDIEPDVRLLHESLHRPSPLHPRRTLDQSYFWKLANTGQRDQDQVVYRETKGSRNKFMRERVIMVDQLWLYILDENTIISSFPKRWGRNKPDLSGVHKGIRSRLEHLQDGDVQSIYDLAVIIMNQCSIVFFDRTKSQDERPGMMDIFANAIGNVSEMKTIAFQVFWKHLHRLGPLDSDEIDEETLAKVYLNINPEGKLLREAYDIIEELRMMARIYTHQLRVVKQFQKSLHRINGFSNGVSGQLTELPLENSEMVPIQNGHLQLSKRLEQHTLCHSIPSSTLAKASDLIDDITDRRGELQDFEENTRDISEHLQGLLSLKQQQASIIEAETARALANESVSQGRSIMLFTIITIIFLPLSFMSSIFGMNASDLSGQNGGIMSLNKEFTFMFPISLGVIIVSLAVAFSTWIRNLFYLMTTIMFASLVEYTGLRKVWNDSMYNAKGLSKKQKYIKTKIYERTDLKGLKEALEKIEKARYLENIDKHEQNGTRNYRATRRERQLSDRQDMV